MFRSTFLTLAASSMLRVCGTHAAPPAAPAQVGVVPGMIPEHGGAMAVSGGVVSEVAAMPDGRIAAYVRDPRHAPIANANVELRMRTPDGQLHPVPVAYDPTMQAYVGRPMGVLPGSYPVTLDVQPRGTSAPVQIVTPPVTISTITPIPPARFGGSVQLVGDHAVEMVATPSGDVAMFWMNLDGTPIPANQVQAPNVTVMVEGRPHIVPTHIDNDRIVAHVPVAPAGAVQVLVPRVVVRGVPYTTVVAPVAPVVAVLPPPQPIVVAAPAPAVIVAAPVAPAVVVAPTLFGIGRVDDHVPHGHAYGYWGHHGAVVVGAPGPVIVAPPHPGVVFVGHGPGGHEGHIGFGGGHGHGHR